ncbi:hypothetical protein [Pseudoalteromonas luteoviolacea]|uniref:Uncharacterized protein n=1 Tax=Pseudoalteromonas luteoviolacea S4060-1 TaxID=1365257 RepID=A0A167N4R1_9GAMM|nr:hypothetical protein [Pseudoalteromonas luteoviolacea]KZN67501.1 hypothetical protein N478_01755 [Pseudoalteromonas luteoviolacea S4060-1]
MLSNKIRYLFIFSILALILTNVLTHIQVTALSARINSLENMLQHAELLRPPAQTNLNNEVQAIQTRVSHIEHLVKKLQVNNPAAKPSQAITPNNTRIEKQNREHLAFLAGRTQWEEKYFSTLYEDADKKAQLMVDHVSQSHDLTSTQQQRLFSTLRDNFIEVAHVITDQETYPTFDDLANKIAELNQLKSKQLSEFLTDAQLKQLNNVDWVNRFKQHAL